MNKPEEIPYLNPSKIYKKLSFVRKKDILFPKAITKKENDISLLYFEIIIKKYFLNVKY